MLGGIFGSLTYNGYADLSIAVSSGFIGVAIGIYLKRFFALHPEVDHHVTRAQMIANLMEYDQDRFPWMLLPKRMRESVFDAIRSRFTDGPTERQVQDS